MINRQALRILVLSALFALFAGACSGGGETAAQPEADDSAAAAPVASDRDAQDDRTVAAVEGDGPAPNDDADEAGSSGDAVAAAPGYDAAVDEGDSNQVGATAGTVGTDRDAPSNSGTTSEVARAVSQTVGPRVADMGDRDLVVVEHAGHDRRSHAFTIRLTLGRLEDNFIGTIDRVAQHN